MEYSTTFINSIAEDMHKQEEYENERILRLEKDNRFNRRISLFFSNCWHTCPNNCDTDFNRDHNLRNSLESCCVSSIKMLIVCCNLNSTYAFNTTHIANIIIIAKSISTFSPFHTKKKLPFLTTSYWLHKTNYQFLSFVPISSLFILVTSIHMLHIFHPLL